MSVRLEFLLRVETPMDTTCRSDSTNSLACLLPAPEPWRLIYPSYRAGQFELNDLFSGETGFPEVGSRELYQLFLLIREKERFLLNNGNAQCSRTWDLPIGLGIPH